MSEVKKCSVDPFSLVEGNWKSFQIRRILKEDYLDIFQHIKTHYLKSEPLCSLLGYSDAFASEIFSLVKIMLNENLSFMAIDISTNKVASIRINFSSKILNEIDSVQLKEFQTNVFWNGIDLPEDVKKGILSKHNVDEYIEFFIASTDSTFRNQGLALEMYKRSLIFLKACGYLVVKCIFTSPISRHLGEKLGFEEIYRIYFKELKGFNGELVFQGRHELSDDEHYACAMTKRIE